MMMMMMMMMMMIMMMMMMMMVMMIMTMTITIIIIKIKIKKIIIIIIIMMRKTTKIMKTLECIQNEWMEKMAKEKINNYQILSRNQSNQSLQKINEFGNTTENN